MNIGHVIKKYLNLILSVIALITVIVLKIIHFEYYGIETIIFAAIALVLGYWFGKWTCHLHKNQSGFWITIIAFAALNFLHSMIDGASVGNLSSFGNAIAILSHEFARQPALYIVLWGMLTPFALSTLNRFIIVPIVVTFIWLLGMYFGFQFFQNINETSWLEPIADQAMFLFLGDILHHIIEEYRKIKNVKNCCHIDN